MPRTLTSWVWEHCERSENGNEAICKLCNEVLQTRGSTSSLNKHLLFVHGFQFERREEVTVNQQNDDGNAPKRSPSSSRANVQWATENVRDTGSTDSTNITATGSRMSRPAMPRGCVRSVASGARPDRPCNRDRSELITQSLTKMVAVNMLPLSFVASSGFREFMLVLEPNYKAPCVLTMKKRLVFLFEQVTAKISAELATASAVAWTSDCWSSRSQDAYISVTVHFVNPSWTPKSFTLATEELSERHTAANLTEKLQSVMTQWDLNGKVSAVVTDNAVNAINSVRGLEHLLINKGVTCSAHTIQLCVTKALRIEAGTAVCERASKVVSHFRHSNIAAAALEQNQERLGLPKLKLIQSCSTRWDSTYAMISRLILNRNPVTMVLADRTLTNPATAERLEISEREWSIMESLQIVLKPLQVATIVLCSDSHAPISMVRPIIFMLRDNHYCESREDEPLISLMKETLRDELTSRFDLDCSDEPNARQVASFLDPRYKDLIVEPLPARKSIRDFVLSQFSENVDEDLQEESHETAMDFLFQVTPKRNNTETQFEMYLAEPQTSHNVNPFDWWSTREKRYPALAELARRYLCIPASSASSERAFSTAGNIVSPKRNCLLPENVNLLVFLYQNRNLLPSLQ